MSLRDVRAHPVSRALQFFKEALRATDRDFSRGPIRPALVLLAIPMVLEMAMEAIFAIVDIFWISRLGADAVAVVGLTEAMLAIVYALCMGFGMGVTAVVARRFGENRKSDAAIACGQALWLCAVFGALVGAAGWLHAESLLTFMGAETATIADGAGYTRWLLAGSASIFYLFVLNAVFRGAGDAAIAMRALVLANSINLVLDPLLIFGWWVFPELGVAGAAIATTIGRSAGVLYQLFWLFRANARIRMTLGALGWHGAEMWILLRVSAGGIAQFMVAMSSWLFMLRIVASFGAHATAGFTIALRIVEFVILPAWGLGNAAATLVGQSLGAGLPDRAAKVAWRAAVYNTVAMVLVALVLVLFDGGIISLFTTDPAISTYARKAIIWFGAGLPLYAVGMILTQSINGAGDTGTPTVLNLVFFWLLQIPAGYFMAFSTDLKTDGVLLAIIGSECLLSIAAVLVFRRGRWQRQAV